MKSTVSCLILFLVEVSSLSKVCLIFAGASKKLIFTGSVTGDLKAPKVNRIGAMIPVGDCSASKCKARVLHLCISHLGIHPDAKGIRASEQTDADGALNFWRETSLRLRTCSRLLSHTSFQEKVAEGVGVSKSTIAI